LAGCPRARMVLQTLSLFFSRRPVMNTVRFRSSVVALIATAGFAGSAVVPAVSQAQWHTIVVGGQVFTHANFTEGGVSPCTRIGEQLGAAENLVGDDHDWGELKGISRAGLENATKDLEANEAAVLRAQQEAFEYGCDNAPA
jgi:hypothetical protein